MLCFSHRTRKSCGFCKLEVKIASDFNDLTAAQAEAEEHRQQRAAADRATQNA
jgi:hypothetical protein